MHLAPSPCFLAACQSVTIFVFGQWARLHHTKAALIVLDNWGLAALSAQDRADALEILDDRIDTGSTPIASQLPVDTWHPYLGKPTLADAILDRLVHQSHRIDLKLPGESMRKNRATADAGASTRPAGGTVLRSSLLSKKRNPGVPSATPAQYRLDGS